MSEKVKRILFYGVVAILVGVIIYCGYNLGKYAIESLATKSLYTGTAEDKNAIVQQQAQKGDTRPALPPETKPGDTTPTPTEPPKPTLVTIQHPTTGESMEILPEFVDAFQTNQDLVGWICIPGTDIDYPVVQTPDRVDYYLKRDFNKKYNSHGCIYAREQCDINAPSDNITLYGHRMQDGSMFAQLINYNKKDFFESHRYIYFDTLTERHNYEIIAVFKTTATLGKGFQYHQFVDAISEESFNQFVATCKSNSFYDTGVTAQYGDKLICLSTCEYSQTNGRLVIVAKRIA